MHSIIKEIALIFYSGDILLGINSFIKKEKKRLFSLEICSDTTDQ